MLLATFNPILAFELGKL